MFQPFNCSASVHLVEVSGLIQGISLFLFQQLTSDRLDFHLPCPSLRSSKDCVWDVILSDNPLQSLETGVLEGVSLEVSCAIQQLLDIFICCC